MPTQWREIANYDYGEGIYRVTASTDPKFPKNALYDALNVVYEGDSNNPSGMPGATRLGSTAMGGAVSGLFDYNNGDKAVATSEDGKIWHYGSDWTVSSGARATGNSTTAGVRWSGEMFYGATTTANLLVLANGVDAPIRYDTSNGAVSLGGSPPSTGNFPIAWQGRLWLFAGSTAYYSAPNDCEDWTTGGGGGSVTVYRGHDGDITGAAIFANNLFVFKRSSVYRIAPTSTFTEVNVRNVNSSVGCVSHQTIAEVTGSDVNLLVWWSEHGIEAISPSTASAGFETRNTARWVQPLASFRNIDAMSTAWSLFNINRMEYWSAYPTGSRTIPSRWLIGNFSRSRQRARWTRSDRQNMTAGMVFNTSNTGYDQYVGDSSGKVYKMFDTSTDNWDGSKFLRRTQTAYDVNNAPNRMKRYGHSHVSVETPASSTVTSRQIMLRPSMPSPESSNTQNLARVGDADGWGVGQWGVALWGGSGYSGERIRPKTVQRALGMAHLIESYNTYTLRGITIASKVLTNKTY